MWMWWPPYRRRVIAEADEYLESFGDQAYVQCRADYRAETDEKRGRFLADVRSVLARKFKHDIGLDTATRYLEQQEPYDHGPGLVSHRAKNTTLH